MPKYFYLFLLVISLFLTACSSSKNLLLNEKTAPANLEKFNDQEIRQRIMDLKNGLKPKIKKPSKHTPPNNKPKIYP